jgi:hypothetical protein
MQEMKHTGKIVNEQAPSVKLIKGQKGAYGWEVKAFGNNLNDVIEKVKEANEQLQNQFGSQG